MKAVPNRAVLTRDERAEEMRRSAVDTTYVDAATGWAASEAWAVAAAAGRATPASAGPAATRPAVSAAPTRPFLTGPTTDGCAHGWVLPGRLLCVARAAP